MRAHTLPVHSCVCKWISGDRKIAGVVAEGKGKCWDSGSTHTERDQVRAIVQEQQKAGG